jgi:hypothetical protein
MEKLFPEGERDYACELVCGTPRDLRGGPSLLRVRAIEANLIRPKRFMVARASQKLPRHPLITMNSISPGFSSLPFRRNG